MFTYMMGKGGAPTVVLPTGAIIPLYGTGGVPSGWTVWSTANNRCIIGAGSTFGVGSQGGAVAASAVVAHPGTHTVSASGFRGGGGSWAGTTAQGIHYHTGTMIALTHPYHSLRFISLDSASEIIPQNGMLMFHQGSVPGALTKFNAGASNRLLRAASASGSYIITTIGVSLPNDGSHNHGGNEGGSTGGSQGSNWKGGAPALHGHNATLSLTFNVYRTTLHLGRPASSSVNINDFTQPIILYTNTTPPDGWVLCDGNNDSPDMRDQLVEITTSVSSPGVPYGTGVVSAAGVWSTTLGDHDHDNGDKCGDCSEDSAYHAAMGGAHPHAVSLGATAFRPLYYGLAFMMKT